MNTATNKDGPASNAIFGNGTQSKRNKVGVISGDNNLHEVFGNKLIEQGFDVSALSLEEITKGATQNFYFVDLGGLDVYSAVIGQIRSVRELRPDSELILLQTPSTLSRPQAMPLKVAVERHLVPVYERPIEAGQTSDYKKSLQTFVEIALREHMTRFLTQPSLIKIGGSIFDLYERNPDVLMALLEEAKRLHSEGYFLGLNIGGGPRQVTEGDLSRALGIIPASREVLERQAKDIVRLLGSVAIYVPPNRVKSHPFNTDFMRQYIPVVSLSGEKTIPDDTSDTHTLAFGDQLRLYKVVFAKDTDGVYERDPYREPRRIRARLPIPSFFLREDNRFFPKIYASDILNGVIDRNDSEGRGEHLIETSALIYLRDRTQTVRAVQVINGTKPELLRKALDGIFVGSYILKG